MGKLRLVSHEGQKVVQKHHERPFWAYYYSHGLKLGHDKIGRATTAERAASAAFKQVLKHGYTRVDIFLNDEARVGSIRRMGRRITIQMK